MASAQVLSPVKSRTQSVRTASRKPMTASPQTNRRRQPRQDVAPSPSPAKKKTMTTAGRHSPPRRLDLGLSDWPLPGPSSAAASPTRSASIPARPPSRGLKTSVRIPYAAGADRFIPTRTVAETAPAKLDRAPSRTSSAVATTFAAAGADAFGTTSAGDDDLAAALDRLGLGDADAADGAGARDEGDGPDGPAASAEQDAGYASELASACGVKLNTRILAFKPAPPESSKPIDLRTRYSRPAPSQARAASVGGQRRRIATQAERVLDAPNLVDDYYLNLLDWSANNQVAIGLGPSVYVWSADSGEVDLLCESAADTYVSSVRWSDDGAFVAVGLGSGTVQIWDVEAQSRVRSMAGHDTRVGCLAWTNHTLTSGARNGWVFNHDVRIADHHVATLDAHTSEVCGLEWRADGAMLASGGNDNLVAIWDARALQAPRFAKTNHTAAVKALAWSPWQSNLLASGGGSADRQIHFWNTTSGARVNSIDTGSQVTSLRWSSVPGYREIASTSGYPDNAITVWSYPSLARLADIPAHDSRILHSAVSPDGQTIATAAADENLKFWKIFERKKGSAIGALPGAAKAVAGLSSGMLR